MTPTLEIRWSPDYKVVTLIDWARNGEEVFQGTLTQFATWALVEKYGEVIQTIEAN